MLHEGYPSLVCALYSMEPGQNWTNTRIQINYTAEDKPHCDFVLCLTTSIPSRLIFGMVGKERDTQSGVGSTGTCSNLAGLEYSSSSA